MGVLTAVTAAGRPHVIGLTGSIGMGKTTTAAFFADAGVAVWSADYVVHGLYAAGGAAVPAVAALCPDAVRGGAVDRDALAGRIAADPTLLRRIEAAVHPLVSADRAAFLAASAEAGADIVVLDIPLLFETGADASVDSIVVVTAPPEVQRARVLNRPGMTPSRLETILTRQLPDREKRRLADHVIETTSISSARAAVMDIVARLRQAHVHA
jgi:dephospho-CoA kinase